ncbi:hypothetical protein DCO58_05265 [Helicobacter saguini]|uniref:Uncharacterized protein n=1 Tax=Helicobacter saguini TaxID=1548018 RepID=A0A347VT47_9HELI|nr:hypothetical protein [Helicobacter saguini]MWV62241.1 hypothetical protein [Helicobacter saguini]MWV67086.1 hypothetical protein [Helicobacter saguini]MWV69436.1 hypothetical protein [Helicobacter saguini]MWV71011.1 hypothetical protein [Helicobacter saguini]TLD91755.1 hypothetical protein LS64_011390 [Helicobacter saguini]
MATRRRTSTTKGTDWGSVIVATLPHVLDFVKEIFTDSKKEQEKPPQVVKEIIREVQATPPVDVKNAELEMIQKINKILSDYKNKALSEAESKENRLINVYQSYIDKIADSINDVDLTKLERLKSHAKTQLQGSISSEIMRNLSIDNIKCEQILKTAESSYRGILMQEFINEINVNALKKAKDILIDNLNESISDIKKILNDRLSSEESSLRASLNYLNDFKASHNLDSKEAKEIELCYQIYLESNGLNTIKSFD